MELYKLYGKTYVIGIDHGYGNMKTCHFIFKSGVTEEDEVPAMNCTYILYNGKCYVIGEHHKVFNWSKTDDDHYYILTLAAIAKELERIGIDKADVILAVGLPLNWVNKQKDKFKEYLFKKTDVTFNYCGKKYVIHIKDIEVYPQSFSAIAARLPEFKGNTMLVDIGNGTINTLMISDGIPQRDTMKTDELGVNKCLTTIQDMIMDTMGKYLTDNDIEKYLINGDLDINNNIKDLMKKGVDKYIEDVFNTLKKRGYDPDLHKLYLVGGGARIIKNFDTKYFESATKEDDIHLTAKGYEDLYIKTHK